MNKEETCKNCNHRPVDDGGSIEPPYDGENRRLDETCPCINKADWHYSYVPEDDFFCAYVEKKSVTPVHKKSKWIPVSERLPKDRDWYLGIFKEPDTGWINPIPFICDYVGKETKATTKECWILKECTDREEHIDYYFNLECVAWMPLPEPYKTESVGE